MKFRKKPIIVEAEKFTMLSSMDGDTPSHPAIVKRFFKRGWWLPTLEGWMRIWPGYWIVMGIAGELYGVRPGIFEATFEKDTPNE